MAAMVVAEVDLRAGDPAAAHARIASLRELTTGNGLGFIGSTTLPLWTIDVEALIALGRVDDAQRVAEDLSERAATSENPNAQAVAHRCLGLTRAAEGELDDALAALELALEAHARRTLLPELGRTLLEKGSIERRAKRKTAAKASLERALEILQPLGAAIFVDRARDELGRIGLRRSIASEGLTPAQSRVAELAAAGATNCEIAKTLYMSERTVESHLTKTYGELGIRSRAQLATALAARAASVTSDRPDNEASIGGADPALI
jgi:DNA-binding CsgD family transcriptional regulator